MNWVGRHKLLSAVMATVVVVAFANSGSGTEDDQPTAEAPQSEAVFADDEPESSPEPAPQKKPKKAKKTFVVVHVIDGDTLDLDNGRRVRLAGIDAPERGQCGYKRARNTLRDLTLGHRVTLGASDEEQDQYGRLLKYVDVGRTDAGLRLIEKGLAVARYDSRDGYGYHPREARYVAADRASAPFTCAAKPVPLVGQTSEKPKKSCAPGYSPCIRPFPPDLNCPDIGRPVTVTGNDPHGLDRDGDGAACEWS